jgi:hypothetical protein
MSYNSKRDITNVVVGVLVIAAYIIYALWGNSPEPENLKSWAVAMLVFIGIGAAAVIAVQILFHIIYAIGVAVKERERNDTEVERIISSSMAEDERDKFISLKSSRVGTIIAGIGFAAALFVLAFGLPAVAALHVLLGAFAIGSIIEGIVKVYFYENGVRNG